MYAAHFGLREPPFTLTPDPAYLYLSRHHQEALAHLLYGAGEEGGFVQLTGEVGTGKTTLIRTLLEQRLENVDIALCLNPRLTEEELLATVCDELGVAYPRERHTLKVLLDALNAHLLRAHAAGRRTVLIVDEAQNLSRELLEQLRLLTNLETAKHKLLRIILVGQPELRRLLARPDLRQLAQRITARYHLPPLDRRETAAYIAHRLRVAGGREDLFTARARWAIYHRSGGVPRLINAICDRALLGAYGGGRRCVTAAIVARAARQALQGGADRRVFYHGLALGVGLAGLVLTGVGLWLPRSAPAPVVAQLPTPPIVLAPPAAASAAPASSADFAPPDLAALLRQASDDDANNRLLATWGVTLTESSAPFCQQVNAHDLRCLNGRGDWDALRRYDRPALLRLQPADGPPVQILLRELSADRALLEIAGRPVGVPLARLTPLWSGHYLLLWRPRISQDLIGPGATGEAVRWLRRRLALAAGQTVSEPVSDVFDAALAEQLRAFQRQQGLRPDGLAGLRTQVLLNNLAPPPGTPVLSPSVREE